MQDSIRLYSSPSCPQCMLIKRMLAAKGIEYSIVQDVDSLTSKNIKQLPTLEVNNQFYVGASAIRDWIKETNNEQ